MSLPPPVLFSTPRHAHLLPAMAQIHADCVLTDHTIATFLPDASGRLDMGRLLHYWEKRAEEVDQGPKLGRREIVLQFVPGVNGQEELAGYVSLRMPGTETGPFRSVVEKLLVSPRHRRKGIARAVMEKLEEVARKEKGELLVRRLSILGFERSRSADERKQMLDTEVGSPAELVYPRLGYTRLGVVPKYGISPKDGRLSDEVWFYKDLRDD